MTPPRSTSAPVTATRREALRGLSALIATAAASGCTRAPSEKIVPYRASPAGVVPGRASHYATANVVDGDAVGLLVESHEGRPTKIEGNPDHPASLGATRAIDQALVFELYHPGRKRGPLVDGRLAASRAYVSALRAAAPPDRRGRGVHVVLPPTSSALTARTIDRLRQALPEITLHYHAALDRTSTWEGARLAFGRPLEPRPDLAKADVVVLLDADPMAQGPGTLAHARAFASRRRPEVATTATPGSLSRLYAVEASPSVSGSVADHRLALRDGAIGPFARALLAEVARRASGSALAGLAPAGAADARVAAIAADLVRSRGRSAILVGERQPPAVHAAALAINALLGNLGQDAPVALAPSAILDAGESSHASLPALGAALDAGAVDLVIALETDVVYASPADLRLGELWPRARERIALSLFDDATARASRWSLAARHGLESWGDARAFDGTRTLIQPLIAPMYDATAAVELLALLAGASPEDADAHALLRDAWRAEHGDGADDAWRRALARGVVDGSRIDPIAPPALRSDLAAVLARELVPEPPGTPPLEVALRPEPKLHDGRFGGIPWLQELPDPITKLTWTAAAQLSEATALLHGVRSGDVVAIGRDGRTIELPAIVVVGHADGVVTVPLGYGRGDPGVVGASGFVLASAASATSRWGGAASLRRTGRIEDLSCTQHWSDLHDLADGDEVVGTAAAVAAKKPRGGAKKHLLLYETKPTAAAPRQWGMAIDLAACTGCSACVIACQAENSIPTVGRSGVLKRREMHWLRIDRYVSRGAGGTTVVNQPMLCQHCEKAPCEYVCPTAATVHSSDGLNQMVYNRCVGTRFCSGNCPYKVRRFNWFDYHDAEAEPIPLAHNPEVTVRGRGVMEKCSYCVQRIRTAELRAGGPSEPLPDGTVRTACEAACPTGAIVFGDVADARSRVSTTLKSHRTFAELDELGTLPRTRYLTRVTNPNPEMP